MTDLRVQYNEEMVGAEHPTKQDTLNRLVLAEHHSDGTHKNRPGWRRGLRVTYKDSDEIYVGPGEIAVDDGVAVRTYLLAAQTAKAHAVTGGPKLVYVYIDPPSSGNSLGEDNIVLGEAVPVWVDGKHGWYHPTNTDQRWIEQAVAIDGSNNIREFDPSALGRGHFFRAGFTIANNSNTSFVDGDLSPYLPKIDGVTARLRVRLVRDSADASGYVRKNGSTGSGWEVASVTTSGPVQWVTVKVPLDDNALFEYRVTNSGSTITLYLEGYEIG